VCLSSCVRSCAIETFLDVGRVPENNDNDTLKLKKQNYVANDQEEWLDGRNVGYTGYTQKNDVVSKVNKKFISHLTRAQRTPSAAATAQVSHAIITILQ
jgi:hypothetical protein